MSSQQINTTRKPELAGAYRIMTLITAALVLVQPVLAGQWMFKGGSDYLRAHEIMANLVFLSAAIQLLLAILIRFPGKTGRNLILANAALVILTTVQIGLGYSGEDSANATAWHVPLGVFLFGLSVAIASFSARRGENV